MLNLSSFKIKKLIELCDKKTKDIQSYLDLLTVENAEDNIYITEQLAELTFFLDLRDELQLIILK